MNRADKIKVLVNSYSYDQLVEMFEYSLKPHLPQENSFDLLSAITFSALKNMDHKFSELKQCLNRCEAILKS